MRVPVRPVCVAMLLACVVFFPGCNAWYAIFPKKDYDSEPPELPALTRSTAVLVFSKTNGFRHEEAIPAGLEALRAIALRRGWALFETENAAVHNAGQLARFRAVVWHNVSGDVLTGAQRADLRRWIEGGGGFVGIHGSGGDGKYAWDWYVDDLIGAQFIGHPMRPQFQDATVHVEDRDHPATRHLPATWVHNEEWYSFEASPRGRGARVLATVDESTYEPETPFKDLRMGDDHPVLWTHCIGEGRVLYSALGHQAGAYALPEYIGVLEGAIAWVAGLEDDACEHRLAPLASEDD